MRILLHFPTWQNRWIPYVKAALREFDVTLCHEEKNLEKLCEVSAKHDLLLSMWANDIVAVWTIKFPEKKIVTYLRRFEMWESGFMQNIVWSAVDKVIFVSKWCREAANELLIHNEITPPDDQRVIPNGIDIEEFPLRKERPNTKKIGLVCSLKEVKNVPLAFQIMLGLPEEYTLHHIGLPYRSQDTGQLFSYARGLPGVANRFYTEWYIPKNKVREWLEDKDFIISTSLNEGNPNNIIEAMSAGVKPIIHNWPGAKDQFPEDLIFSRVSEAVGLITDNTYEPQRYRDWVESRYSLDNFKQLTATIKELI